ncbi:MAG: RtcB family protein [Elusimicrobia bacterium]|nr:RtcB family protein [Elusimicrobiota bacterium]
MKAHKVGDFVWEIPKSGAMRVPGRIFASQDMIGRIERERVAEQVANVACLPGIVGASLAMPDCHWGYGAPVGGVAATDARTGVVSPGLVGYDISCGMRLLASGLDAAAVRPNAGALMDALHAGVASGVGKGGAIRLGARELETVLAQGARWVVERGRGEPKDLEVLEDGGLAAGADPGKVSARALERGGGQLGTLGSGNHFLELQEVDEVYDETAAAAFGLRRGQFVLMIHTGSRGLGYQVCTDALTAMPAAMRRAQISLPDRQLACAPLDSREGRDYLGAMAAAANFARANRQEITHAARKACAAALPEDARLCVVYDLSHNLATMEEHGGRKLCVHRKGATRAFPAGHPSVTPAYRAAGQPVLVPGTMGTASYVLVGTDGALRDTFASLCHGAGRVMSRTEASKRVRPAELKARLDRYGVTARTDSWKGFAEEAPEAYKDVAEVVEVCVQAGLAKKVVRLKPFGVLKG